MRSSEQRRGANGPAGKVRCLGIECYSRSSRARNHLFALLFPSQTFIQPYAKLAHNRIAGSFRPDVEIISVEPNVRFQEFNKVASVYLMTNR